MAVAFVCRTRSDFIVDDVWRAMSNSRPDEARAMGAIILKAARAGLCERTTEYRISAQKQCHGNPRVVWRSLVYRP